MYVGHLSMKQILNSFFLTATWYSTDVPHFIYSTLKEHFQLLLEWCSEHWPYLFTHLCYFCIFIHLVYKFLYTKSQKVYKSKALTSMIYYYLSLPAVLTHWLAEISRTYTRFFSELPIRFQTSLSIPPHNTTRILWYLIISGYFPKYSSSPNHVPAPGPNSVPFWWHDATDCPSITVLLLLTLPAIRHQQCQRALIPIKIQVWRLIISVIQAGTSDIELREGGGSVVTCLGLPCKSG